MKQQIEDLIMERIGDREHAEIYNSMIKKREDEIDQLTKSIEDCRDYDKVCKQRKEYLKDTMLVLDDILQEGIISNANLRMLVKGITVHQREDKSLNITFEMNGGFDRGGMQMVSEWFLPEYEVDGVG